jgi:hypothetical protein
MLPVGPELDNGNSGWRFVMRRLLVLPVFLLAVLALGQDQPVSADNSRQADWSAITIRAPYGFEYPSSYFNPPPNTTIINSYEGFLFIGLPASPPVLGHFDTNGKVIGGDYVLIYCVDLGTAPITTVWFYGLFATLDQPVVCRGFDNGGQPLAQYEFPLGAIGGEYHLGALTIHTEVRGSEGTVTLGVALLERKHQSLETVWGTTISQVIRIDDSAGPYGGFIRLSDETLGYHTASFSLGGAAHFKHAAHELAREK